MSDENSLGRDEDILISRYVNIQNGECVFDVTGNSFESVFSVDTEPLALYWDECSGSIDQLLMRLSDFNYGLSYKAVFEMLNKSAGSPNTLLRSLGVIFELFTPGTYKVELYRPRSNPFYIFKEHILTAISLYPYGSTYIPTLSPANFKMPVVESYKEKLLNGLRPIALTCGIDNGCCEFIIDGHHKLIAYEELGISPFLVRIIAKSSNEQIALCKQPFESLSSLKSVNTDAIASQIRNKRNVLRWSDDAIKARFGQRALDLSSDSFIYRKYLDCRYSYEFHRSE